MQHRWPAFEAYVAQAANDRNTLPRIAATVTLCTLVAIIFTFGLFAVAILIEEFFPGTSLVPESGSSLPMLALFLAGISTLWIGVWLGLRFVHRRSLTGVLAHDGRMPGRDLLRGAAVGLAVPLVLAAATFSFGPPAVRSDIGIVPWAVAALPIAVLVLAQSSAEEAFFRGYLHQALAARTSKAAIWLVLPTAAFALLHWQDDVALWKNAMVLAAVAAFSLSLSLLVVVSGRLATAIGLHFGNNVFALQLFAFDDEFGAAALFHLPSLADAAWTPAMLGLGVLSAIAMNAFQLWLLLHPRSPLRIGRV